MIFTVITSRNRGTDNNISHCGTHCGWKTAVAAIVFLLAAAVASAQRAVPRPVPHKTPAQSVPATPSSQAAAAALPDSIDIGLPLPESTRAEVIEDEVRQAGDSLSVTPVDTVPVLTAGEALGALEPDSVAPFPAEAKPDEWEPRDVEFVPDPTKAVWFSALFPGLGQVYNRRYWKLPIIVGGYLGLAYATNWNNTMLSDYTRAYRDLLDNDPSTKSYMDMFAPNVKEEDLDKSWLQNVLRSRKNYFRRNRDLCIIGMVGVYLLAMVDAYVDASLSHFDISPDLSMDVVPSLMQDGRNRYPSVGMTWALNF